MADNPEIPDTLCERLKRDPFYQSTREWLKVHKKDLGEALGLYADDEVMAVALWRLRDLLGSSRLTGPKDDAEYLPQRDAARGVAW